MMRRRRKRKETKKKMTRRRRAQVVSVKLMTRAMRRIARLRRPIRPSPLCLLYGLSCLGDYLPVQRLLHLTHKCKMSISFQKQQRPFHVCMVGGRWPNVTVWDPGRFDEACQAQWLAKDELH